MELAESDPRYREELWIMCSRDPLFTINVFGWTYDPRKISCPTLPFITYPFQDFAILELVKAIRLGYDILGEKSRDMGATWIFAYTNTWFFTFCSMFSCLMASRKEDLVDKTEDPDCLFWKIDFLLEHFPAFLRPKVSRQKLHFHNETNGSTIDGASTTGDLGRGGRRTAVFLDEFAAVPEGFDVLKATRDMTRCRMFVSTPKGSGNAFYKMRNTDIKKLRFHWTEHPEKAAGLYTSDSKGNLIIKDESYIYPPGFKPILDEKMRSPWYDNECKRCANEVEIAQELDIDYLGSAYQFFDAKTLNKIDLEWVEPPCFIGELDFDWDSLLPYDLRKQENGRLWLWINTANPNRKYVVGADISQGTGATNSVATIGDKLTGEVVGVFASPGLKPTMFAKYVVAICKFFNNAFLIWEANGPGRSFGDEVVSLGYGHIFFRKTNQESIIDKKSKFPGWWSTRETKLVLLSDYRQALVDGRLVDRCRETNDERRSYVFQQDGTVSHAEAASTEDPTGARDNHGDRVISGAVMWHCMKTKSKSHRVDELDLTITKPPKDSPISRIIERRKERMRSIRW